MSYYDGVALRRVQFFDNAARPRAVVGVVCIGHGGIAYLVLCAKRSLQSGDDFSVFLVAVSSRALKKYNLRGHGRFPLHLYR
jgi:hypothetical protein